MPTDKSKIKFEILESRKMFEKFNGMSKAINDEMSKIVYKHTLDLETEAKLNVTRTGDEHPQVKTGRLRGSITHQVGIENGAIVGKVGTTVVYGPQLEYGTDRHPPYAWLYPALAKIQPLFNKAVYDLKTTIFNFWRR